MSEPALSIVVAWVVPGPEGMVAVLLVLVVLRVVEQWWFSRGDTLDQVGLVHGGNHWGR